jgi:hypothetical protein
LVGGVYLQNAVKKTFHGHSILIRKLDVRDCRLQGRAGKWHHIM